MAKSDNKEVIDERVKDAEKVLKQFTDKNNVYVQTPFFKTGFPLFDYYFGGSVNIHDKDGNFIKQELRPGQAGGTFNMYVGASQSGKTTLSIQMAANIARQFPKSKVVQFDSEERATISRAQTITQLPITWFDSFNPDQRYFIYNDWPTLEKVNQWIVERFIEKASNPSEYLMDLKQNDEFNRPIVGFVPDVAILDSYATLSARAFNVNNAKESKEAAELKGRTGPQDALTSSSFLRNIMPVCKKGGIIVNGINHVKVKISMSMFQPNKKDMPFIGADDTFPGGNALKYLSCNIPNMSSTNELFTMEEDGFSGRLIMVEPWKSSYNISGNKRSGEYFYLVLNNDIGFDSLRSLIVFGRERGLIEGNRNRLKFKGHDEFTFNMKNLDTEKKEKPIWQCIRELIYPYLENISNKANMVTTFDEETLNY